MVERSSRFRSAPFPTARGPPASSDEKGSARTKPSGAVNLGGGAQPCEQNRCVVRDGPTRIVFEASCSPLWVMLLRRRKALPSNLSCTPPELFELRAAISLARLWRDQGRRNEACELLAPIYGWFTEGFETPVLQDAKALLDQLT